ncbi:MAG: protein kinase [Armatimonadota bacterium]
MIGQVVNYRYEILEKSGDGSFFSVYKARDKVLNRLVAVKTMVPQYSQNREFAERMTEETQMVADLNHPNIAKVLEADNDNGTYFTAVEYVRGINLKERIRRTAPFTISYAVDIAIAVGSALEYAHRQGVVHGDVRPQNILTNSEGQVKLTDFGTARALSAFPVIREAVMLRSVHYMAPEVIRGEAPEPASDVYSLGVVLYEMLTGSVPFDAATSAAIAARTLQDPVPSPHVLNSGVPATLNEIVMKAMHKDPSQRFESAADFVTALMRVKEWLRTGYIPSAHEHPKPEPKDELVYESEDKSQSFFKTTAIWLLAVFVVAIITAGLVAWLFREKQTLPVPDLVGKTVEQAREIAGRTGLEIRDNDVHQEYNDKVDKGLIYAMDPRQGGTVPKEQPFIQVWISKGTELVDVPSVVGLTMDEAEHKINGAGLVVRRLTSEYSDTVPSDHIIRQSPTSGEQIEPMKEVDIVLSLGQNPMEKDTTSNETSGDDQTDNGSVQTRSFLVKVQVPSDATEPQQVRIVVIDDNGENEAYNEYHDPGDSFTQEVTGTGNKIRVKVYVGDNLLKDEVHNSRSRRR